MSDLAALFDIDRSADGSWSFNLPERFNGAFGGTNGGVLTALSVHVARQIGGRRPASVDSRYLRGFRPGRARALPSMLNEGRTLSVIGIDIVDGDGRPCTHSTITLADPNSLAHELEVGSGQMPPVLDSMDAQRRWPHPERAPIPLIDTFEPTQLARTGTETVTGIVIPWRQSGTSEEAACIAADISVGPPVARAVRGAASTPNPDLSLRFCGQVDLVTRPYARCRVERIAAGLASTSVAVWSDSELLAIGVSTTTCLPLR